MSDKDRLALTLHYAIETLSRIAYAGPSVRSLRDDEYRGNEFLMEINRIRQEAELFLKEVLEPDPNYNSRNYTESYNMVLNFFEGDEQKTILWFSTPNPLIGNITPFSMIIEGHSDKLLKLIKSLTEENER